jgi:putative flippase GtrA
MRGASGHLRDLSGTALASVVATALDGLVFSALILALEPPAGLATGACAAAGAACGGVTHFSLCRRWVFSRFDAPLSHAAPRYALMSLLAGLIHAAATSLIATLLPSSLAWGLSKLLVYLGWTYPISRYHVFSTPRAP